MIAKELQKALDAKLFTAAQVLKSESGQVSLHKKVASHSSEVYFDLASLTKPLSTAFLSMLAVQEKYFQISTPVTQILSTKNLDDVAIQSLLNHTAPLKDWYGFGQDEVFRKQGSQIRRQRIIERVLNEKKLQRTSSGILYSDLGYIALTAILEAVYQHRIDQIFLEKIAKPLRIAKEIFYLPLDQKLPHGKAHFVPSEKKCEFRNKQIRAEVMDENTWLMGGVSGHAGLFGTAKAVHKILLEWRMALSGQSKILDQQIAKRFLIPKANRVLSKRHFTLGLDTPTRPGSLSGSLFDKKTIGHLGYSGTSFWWDLKKDIWVIVLTNGRYYGREKPPFLKWLPGFYNQVMTS